MYESALASPTHQIGLPNWETGRILTLVMTQTEPMYRVYTDGGSRGNPGPAAYGFVIYTQDGQVLAEESRYIGVTTNNQAEYQGIVAALQKLTELNLTGSIQCNLDSQLVVRQINGIYKMKNADLRPWLEQIQTLRQRISGPITFIDIPREKNREADRLVNEALDAVAKG